MAVKTITITEEAYSRLSRLKSSERESFSDVILKCFPEKTELLEILEEIGEERNDLADSIEEASRDMRKSRLQRIDL